MTFRVYLSPPDVGALEKEFVMDSLESGWVAPLGPHVDGFEQELAAFLGVPYAVALSSGTAGLHLALLTAGVGPGDEVICPTMTFAATAFAIVYVGAQPIFVDSERASWNIDPLLVRDLLERRREIGRVPAALIAVDLFGQSADYAELAPICAEFGVVLIEDAAEALGATHGSRMAGSYGRAGVFSFNGNKIMTTSGGGMVVTHDETLADRIRHLATQARQPVPWYEHEDIGFNYRMSNVLAALGRAQLSRLPQMIEKRLVHRNRYRELLGAANVKIVDDADWGTGNSWLTLALFADESLPVVVREALAVAGIESRPVWKPMHRQPIFAGAESQLNGVSDDFFGRGLCLPSGSQMPAEDCELVCRIVLDTLDRM